MATISGNGGAARYWRSGELRAVLCKNGVVLIQRGSGARWRSGSAYAGPAGPVGPGWQPDTGQAARAAVTRTGRQARREEG